MLGHHHDDGGPPSAEERERLLSTGTKIEGMVCRTEPLPADRTRSVIRVELWLEDKTKVEFSEELANLYQPEAGSPQAQRVADARGAEQLRHPGRIPKIQVPLSLGERVPLRYDPSHPRSIVVDVPALHKRALDDYVAREKRSKSPADEGAVASGPPWEVPTKCPTCGAPVDQATASTDRDPHCPFCHEPIPVSVRGRR